MALSETDIAELRKLIASGVRGKGQVEVVEFSHSSFDAPMFFTGQMKDEFQVTLETGETVTTRYAPMTVQKESSGALLLGDRGITIQGVNDLVAAQEELIPLDSTEKPVVKIRSFVARNDGSISGVAAGPFKLYATVVDYNESNQSCKVTASTVPTNISETGEISTISRVPMLAGFV